MSAHRFGWGMRCVVCGLSHHDYYWELKDQACVSAPEARAEATPASRTPIDHSPTQDATEGQSETSFGDAK